MPKRSPHPHVSWRGGRPRFTPGPELREGGHKGRDLRHDDGRWYSYGEAVEWSIAFQAGRAGGPAEPVVEAKPLTDYERGFVYFLWAGDAIKVGYSKNPFRRFSTLMTGVSGQVRMFFTVPGTRGDEKRLHRRLAAQHVRGEWFKASLHTLKVMRMVLNEHDGINGEQ